MRRISIKKIFLYIYLLIITLILISFVSALFDSCPDYEYLYLLGPIRDCIWYEFEGYEILYDQPREKIVQPKSLLELTPLRYRVKEYDKEPDNCKLIYNPNGYKDKTWIAVHIGKGFRTKLYGNYVLLYNKEIKRERHILETARKTKGVKYYTVKH